MHRFCCTADSPEVKSFLFYNLLLFCMAKFFKPAGTDIFLGAKEKLCNHFHILFAQLFFCCRVQNYRIFQTLGMLSHELFFTFCYHFANKEQLNYPCM